MIRIIDDAAGPPAFTTIDATGVGWYPYGQEAYYGGTVHYTYPHAAGGSAIWTFGDLPPGIYRFHVSTVPGPNSHAASYSVLDGQELAGSATYDQVTPPDPPSIPDTGGGTYARFGQLGQWPIRSGTARLVLHSDPSDQVIADAAAVELVTSIDPPAPAPGASPARPFRFVPRRRARR